MNPWALFAVFFATLSIVLAYALLASHDTNRLLRYRLNHLWRTNLAQEQHLSACGELLGYCQELERRNLYLEAWMSNFKDTLAGAKLMAPGTIRESEQFTVRDTEKAP